MSTPDVDPAPAPAHRPGDGAAQAHDHLLRHPNADLQQRITHGPVVLLIGDRIVKRRRRPHLRHTADAFNGNERPY